MSAYSDGYQDALGDVKTKWDEDGPEAAIAYILANLVHAEAHLVAGCAVPGCSGPGVRRVRTHPDEPLCETCYGRWQRQGRPDGLPADATARRQ
jgi:hypothetical protein